MQKRWWCRCITQHSLSGASLHAHILGARWVEFYRKQAEDVWLWRCFRGESRHVYLFFQLWQPHHLTSIRDLQHAQKCPPIFMCTEHIYTVSVSTGPTEEHTKYASTFYYKPKTSMGMGFLWLLQARFFLNVKFSVRFAFCPQTEIFERLIVCSMNHSWKHSWSLLCNKCDINCFILWWGG